MLFKIYLVNLLEFANKSLVKSILVNIGHLETVENDSECSFSGDLRSSFTYSRGAVEAEILANIHLTLLCSNKF